MKAGIIVVSLFVVSLICDLVSEYAPICHFDASTILSGKETLKKTHTTLLTAGINRIFYAVIRGNNGIIEGRNETVCCRLNYCRDDKYRFCRLRTIGID